MRPATRAYLDKTGLTDSSSRSDTAAAAQLQQTPTMSQQYDSLEGRGKRTHAHVQHARPCLTRCAIAGPEASLQRPSKPKAYFHDPQKFTFALVLLVVLTVADGVLVVVLFDMYTETYAQFVNQGTAFVYGVTALVILAVRWCRSRSDRDSQPDPSLLPGSDDVVIQRKAPLPWMTLVAIGLFNGSGNFCMGVSQPHTPGLTQVLLYLLNIPLVMILSWVFLNKKASSVAITGAALIVAGTLISGLRAILQPDDGSDPVQPLWYCIMLFACGQIFLGGEKVYEEHTFEHYRRVDVMVMFCVTLWTQFSLGWLLYPIQTIDAFGGLRLSDLPYVIGDGVRCTFGLNSTGPQRPDCSGSNSVIFFTYCVVDFCCYAWGLFVIQKGGANLMVLASAIALPLQQLTLCIPQIMGKYTETFFWGDATALALVLAGYCVYQFLSIEGKKARGLLPASKGPRAGDGESVEAGLLGRYGRDSVAALDPVEPDDVKEVAGGDL